MFPNKKFHSGKQIVSDIRPLPPRQHPAPRTTRTPEEPPFIPRPRRVWLPQKIRTGHVLFVAALVGIIVFSLFWNASLALTITPRFVTVKLDRDTKVTIDAEEVAHNAVQRAEGKSTESQKFSQRAKGTIVVFNNFNAEQQVLVERTRFQAPSGLIFRSIARVTVPGKSGDKPGSAEVDVLADAPGDKYNVGLSDFTIPGFAGTPKFTKFFARSKTEIKGGAAGEGKVVGSKEAGELLAKLEEEVRHELSGGVRDKIPDGVISFPEKTDAPPLTKITDPPIGAPAETFFAEVRGSVRTLVAKKDVWDKTIALVLLRDGAKADIYEVASQPNSIVKSIEMDYVNRKVVVVLSGTVQFRGKVDMEEVRGRVLKAGGEEALNQIFEAYPSIAKVEKIFRPAFFKRIPSRSSRVFIDVVDTKP